MFIQFQCGDCNSSMKIDLQRYIERIHSPSLSSFGTPTISCVACGSKLSRDTAYYLHEFLKIYKSSETNWKISFEFKDVKTLPDKP